MSKCEICGKFFINNKRQGINIITEKGFKRCSCCAECFERSSEMLSRRTPPQHEGQKLAQKELELEPSSPIPFHYPIGYFSTAEFRNKVIANIKFHDSQGTEYWKKKLLESPDTMDENPVLVLESGHILDGHHRMNANSNWTITVLNPEGWYSCPLCKGKSYVEAKIMCIESRIQPLKSLIILKKDEDTTTEAFNFSPTEERPLIQNLRLVTCSDCAFQFVITEKKKKKKD